jgi:hypothetical protein
MKDPQPNPPPFWESARTRLWLWILLWGACALSLAAEAFIHAEHAFHFLGFPLSSAFLGFVACSAMILVAKALGYLLKRKSDYYHDHELL